VIFLLFAQYCPFQAENVVQLFSNRNKNTLSPFTSTIQIQNARTEHILLFFINVSEK